MSAFPRPAVTVAVALAATALVSCSGSESAAPESTQAASVSDSATSASAAPAAPPAPAPAPLTDEDQVKEALQITQDAYNTQNWDAYLEMMCPDQRAKFTGNVMEMLKTTRQQNGLTNVKVLNVTIDGDTAKARVEASNEVLGTQEITMPFERSDGWKLCVREGITG